MEADRIDNSGLNNLLPWEHTPSHSDGLSGVTVGDVLRTLTRGGEKETKKEVEEEEVEEEVEEVEEEVEAPKDERILEKKKMGEKGESR